MLCVECFCVFLVHAEHLEVADGELALDFLNYPADAEVAVGLDHRECPASKYHYLLETDSPSKCLRVKSSAKSTILSCLP